MDGKIERRTRKDGTVAYSQRVEGPLDPTTGKRRRIRITADTERELRIKSRQAIRELEEGTRVRRHGITFEEFAESWLHDIVEPNCRPATISNYRNILTRYAYPFLGHRGLQDLDHVTLQRFMRTVADQGGKDGRPIAARTVRMIHGRLNQVFRRAVEVGYLSRNPMQHIPPPRIEEIDLPVWSVDDARRFLEAAAHDPYEPFWSLALLTGMRRGEILGLRWSEIDLEEGSVRVMRTRLRVDGQTVEEGTKTKSSRRTIPLPDVLTAQLRAIRLARKKAAIRQGRGWSARTEYVVVTPAGTPPVPHLVDHRLPRILEAAGLQRISVHGLRHVHATLMLGRRVNPKIVQERLGHSDVAITLRVYSHVLPSEHRREANDLGGAIVNGGRDASRGEQDDGLSDAL